MSSTDTSAPATSTAQPATLVAPGATLRNGATVVAARHVPADRLAAVVLAIFHGEYVTWVANVDGTATTWGHYFGRDFATAVVDFADR